MLHDPELEVTCDGCEASIYVRLTATARGYDERDVDDQIEDEGWEVVSDHEHYCDECKENRGK